MIRQGGAIRRGMGWLAALVLTGGLAGGAALADTTSVYGAATAALFKQAPTIDGKMAPGEWDGAVSVPGFQKLFMAGAGALEARGGRSWFGFTADRLYIAMVSEYPPDGKDHSSGTTRDKDYVFDESVEVWLDPNRANRQTQAGDLRFYQMNGNARGGIYDISFDPKSGPNTGWNGNWDMQSTVDHERHLWTMELSLPLADLGWPSTGSGQGSPGSAVGKTLGVLIARNFKGPWEQATWFNVNGAFVDWYRYAAIQLTADAPSVQLTTLGENLFSPHLQLRAEIRNPGPARKARVATLLTSSDMPEIKGEKEIDLPAGGTVPYAFDDQPGRLHLDAQHTLAFDVTSPDGGEVYLHYRAKWAKPPEKKWQYRLGPDPNAAFRFAYYPSYQFVRVFLDTRELSKEVEEQAKAAQVAIAGPGGKAVLKDTMSWSNAPATQEFKVGDLPDGEYTLTVTVPGWKEPFTRTFVRKHFPFEGNTLGITDQVLPPFTPVKVAKSRVSVVLRDYEADGLGLWSSIKAGGNVSAGRAEELLAAPIALKADAGAGPEALKGKGKFVETRPNAAVYEGAAETPAVTVKTRCTTELDGCMKVELTLQPGTKNQELRTLSLDIPLKDALMPLWHVCTAGCRINPAGETPAGEGAVWDSRKFPDGNWYGNFKCYLWLGAEERGLCFFADNDAGWVLAVDEKNPDKSAPCQELIRKAGVLTLRLNLVQKPIALKEPRTIVFGLMASPTKPMLAGWRRIAFGDESQFNMGYATPATYCAKAPWGNDFTIADWCYARRTGKPGPTPEQIEAYTARNFPGDMDPAFRESVIKLALGFMNNFRPNQKYYKMYFEEFHTQTQVAPDAHVFQSEWSGRWYTTLLDHPTKAEHKMAGLSVAGIVPSYRDFACWYAAEWVRRGIGCYFDNSFPTRAYDTLTTSAYKLPNGEIQPSAGMWARREYLKRIWAIHRLLGPKDALPIMMIHMTNTQILPYMSWNDENLDLEWKFGPEIMQTKWHPAFLRAECLGRQGGVVPWVIAKVMDTKTAEEKHVAHRTKFGTFMVHEIRWWGAGEDTEAPLIKIVKDFGYALDDCRVWNYWDNGYPVRPSDPEAKSLLLKRGDELLLVVCTWNPQPATVTFTLDAKVIGVAPTTAANAEKPEETYALKNGAFILPLEGYGVRILRVK